MNFIKRKAVTILIIFLTICTYNDNFISIVYGNDLIITTNPINNAVELCNDVIIEELSKIEKEPAPKTYNGITEGDVINNTEFSYYTASPCCCSPQNDGKYYTKDGTHVYIGMENPHIVACKWLPLGSTVEIEGTIYTVKDTGSHPRLKECGGLDIFVPDGVNKCIELGRQYNIPIKILTINID